MNLNKTNKLRFLHIPKSGGSTFGSVIHSQYKGEYIFSFSGDAGLDSKRYETEVRRLGYHPNYFISHAPIVSSVKEANDVLLITFLRDPVERVVSFCQHVSEGKSPHLVDVFPPSSFCVKTFLRSGIDELENLQTKMLINENHCASPKILDELGIELGAEMAFENLIKKVHVFGIQERYDESLIIISDKLGWGLPFYYSRNVKDKSKRVVLDNDDMKLVHELTQADRILYKRARDYFLANYRLTLTQKIKLKIFRTINLCLVPFCYNLGSKFKKFC